MTALAVLASRAALCGPVPDPIAACFDDLAQRSSALFRARLVAHDPAALRQAIAEARVALGAAIARATELAREFAPATAEQLDAELERLLHAFPDASPEDAAGYGAQLADDVIALRPSWRGLRLGCERVRLHQRFTRLPAIATVWDAIGAADRGVLAMAKMIDALPDQIDRAEAALLPRARPTRAIASAPEGSTGGAP